MGANAGALRPSRSGGARPIWRGCRRRRAWPKKRLRRRIRGSRLPGGRSATTVRTRARMRAARRARTVVHAGKLTRNASAWPWRGWTIRGLVECEFRRMRRTPGPEPGLGLLVEDLLEPLGHPADMSGAGDVAVDAHAQFETGQGRQVELTSWGEDQAIGRQGGDAGRQVHRLDDGRGRVGGHADIGQTLRRPSALRPPSCRADGCGRRGAGSASRLVTACERGGRPVEVEIGPARIEAVVIVGASAPRSRRG